MTVTELAVRGSNIAVVIFVKWSRSKEGRPIWHRFVLGLPVLGQLVRTINVGRFSRKSNIGVTVASVPSNGVKSLCSHAISTRPSPIVCGRLNSER